MKMFKYFTSINKDKMQNLILLFSFLIIGTAISYIRLKLIKLGQIDNYGVIEVARSVVFIPVMYLLLNNVSRKYFYRKYLDIFILLVLLLTHEILSKFMEGIGTYDSKDVIGLITGAILTAIMVKSKIIYVA